jgi:hypothetical protein
MTPGSVFLTSLNKAINNSTYKYLTFGSVSDLHVPVEYSTLKGDINSKFEHKHYALNIPGHISLIIYLFIFKVIKEYYEKL